MPRMSRRAARRCWAKALKKETRTKEPRLLHIEVSHDEYCGVFKQAECNCNAGRRLFTASGELIIEVKGVGFYDPFEFKDG